MGKLKPNGFMIFANEYKKTHDLQQSFTFREVLDVASPLWNELSEREKDEYKRKAKFQNSRIELKRSLPSAVNEIEEKRLKLERSCQNKRAEIEDLVYTASDLGDLDDKLFYLLHISTYFEDEKDTYPAELGLAKFSLRKGIMKTLHIKINPGILPYGATYPAQEKANQTHKYLIPKRVDNDEEYNIELGESNYFEILLQIIDFLETDEDIPVFFTELDACSREFLQVQRALFKIFEKAFEYGITTDLKIYTVLDLFYFLNQVVKSDGQASFQTLVQAEVAFELSETQFMHSVEGCAFHEEKDCIQYCSLAKAIRYGYIASKYCVDPTKHPLIEGQHYPKET